MKITLVQYAPLWEDKNGNKEKLTGLINQRKSVSDEDINFMILPELTLTGFTMKSQLFAEPLDGETADFYKKLAVENDSFIAGGLIEEDTGKYFNTLIFITPDGKIQNSYRKIHPFSYSTENEHYSRGENIVSTRMGEWTTGLSICYDLRFPELYRKYAQQRTELIINIANWPITRIEHWKILLRARAIENQCYVAGVNRTGSDPKLQYNGCSVVYSPMGDQLTQFTDDEQLICAELDINTLKDTRKKFPFLEDMHLIQ